jgi:hypothetical protein
MVLKLILILPGVEPVQPGEETGELYITTEQVNHFKKQELLNKHDWVGGS